MKSMTFRVMIFSFCLMICQALHAQQHPAFAKGADISWLPQMEASGYHFKDMKGNEKDCLLILKELGFNAIRLRVFVNPNDDKTSGHCNKEETVSLALRAQRLGFRLMIDLHYSDSWADPAKQNKPKAWAGHDFPTLLKDVYNHTYDVMMALKNAGVTPEWVQIGNEIPGGLLWPDGSTNNWTQLGQLLNQGYNAAISADTSIKVIIHIDEGNNIQKSSDFFEHITQEKVNYDVIGLSYYPYWIKKDYTETINDLETNLNLLTQKYHKEVMIVEVGGEVNKIQNTFEMLKATLAVTRKVKHHKGIGVFYWEPESIQSWSGYNLGAWLKNGAPSPALNAFKK